MVGIGFPVYSTHKAIKRKSPAEKEHWLVCWAGQFSIFLSILAEIKIFLDKVLGCI